MREWEVEHADGRHDLGVPTERLLEMAKAGGPAFGARVRQNDEDAWCWISEVVFVAGPGGVVGPVPLALVRRGVAAGKIPPDASVRRITGDGWEPIAALGVPLAVAKDDAAGGGGPTANDDAAGGGGSTAAGATVQSVARPPWLGVLLRALLYGSLGAFVGAALSQFAPIFSDVLTRGVCQPLSPCRQSVLPAYLVGGALLGGLVGAIAGLALQRASGSAQPAREPVPPTPALAQLPSAPSSPVRSVGDKRQSTSPALDAERLAPSGSLGWVRRRPGIVAATAVGVVVAATGAALLLRDPARGVYDEAVALEEGGKLDDATDGYDAVCRRSPDSALCAPATTRAAALRLRRAEAALVAFRFAEADSLLRAAADAGDTSARAKAKGELARMDLMEGLAWERADTMPDKHAALAVMEHAAASTTTVREKAVSWLAKERPALLLEDVQKACAKDKDQACAATCRRLVELHPGTPEATTARAVLEARAAAERRRVAPLLAEAETNMKECAELWKRDETRRACAVRQLAADEENVFRVLAVCGDGTKDNQRSDILGDNWRKLLAALDAPELREELDGRHTAACERGVYVAVAPKAEPAGADASTPEPPSMTAGVVGALPDEDTGFVDTRGGWGWGDKCWVSLKAERWAAAKAECDRGLAMNPKSPQPKASLLYNAGLVAKGSGDVAAARRFFEQSLALRDHPEVRAALAALPGR